MVAAHVATFSNAISSAVLCLLGQSLLLGTLSAGLTYILIRLLRLRIGSALETGLWVIVLVKFLVPTGPSWTFSLGSVCRHLFQSSPVHKMPLTDPVALEVEHFYPVDADSLAPGTALPALTVPTHSPTVEDLTPPRWHWSALIGMSYLFCVLILSAWRVHSHRALVMRCRSLPEADQETLAILRNVCLRLGVHRVPTVKISDRDQPFVIGCISPLLVIPRHLLVRPDEVETVIVHEVAHLRRGDIFVRYIEWIAGVLFFFWPVVAWVNRRLDAAREIACDEWALRQGKLTAPEYARCLLLLAQPVRRRRFAYAPSGMATNPKTIERRIDMILQSRRFTSSRRIWRLLALAFLLCWAGITLTGVAAGPGRAGLYHSRTATEESVRNRAAAIYNLVCQREVADFNGDGLVSYLEKDTYLVALAMRNAGPFMEEFPYADRNHSGNLDILEANAVIRAITLIAYADRRACAATEHVLPLEFCHDALDAQEWLLANSASEPEPRELDQIWSVLCRIQGRPTGFAARMLDHGAPEQLTEPRKADPGDRGQFQELENGIAVIEERLASTRDPERIARLEVMLMKLETILSKLRR